MNPNSLPTERVALVGNIDPDAYGTGDFITAYVPMKNFRRFMAVVQAGTLGSSATLDARLRVATSAAGAGAENVTGSAITQLTQAGTDSDKQAIINFDPVVYAGTAFTHVALQISVGTASSDAGGLLFGFDCLYPPADDYDASTVDEIVTVR